MENKLFLMSIVEYLVLPKRINMYFLSYTLNKACFVLAFVRFKLIKNTIRFQTSRLLNSLFI